MNRRTFLAAAGAYGAGALPPSTLDFRKLMPARVPRSAIFKMDDWMVWCSTMVRTRDGVCHMLFSRWPKRFGHGAWVTHSEVAYATAERPEGPYRFRGVALPARGGRYWDGHMTHNPCVMAYKDKFYLYYTANRGPDGWRPDRPVPDRDTSWAHRMNQRVGVAVADHPAGPWKRFDKPLIDTVPEYGTGITATPCAMVRPDGRILLVYKTQTPGPGRFGGGVFHYPAVARDPLGPFVRHAAPMVDKSKTFTKQFNFHIDDHVEWYQDGRYYAIVKDHDAPYLTPYGKVLYLLESSDGLAWRQSKHLLVTEFALDWDDGAREKYKRLEMPKLHFENGRPAVLFLAALPAEDPEQHSFNIAVPLRHKGET